MHTFVFRPSLSVLTMALLVIATGCSTVPKPAGDSAEGVCISGNVVDRNGDPVRGADLFLYYACGEDGVHDRFLGTTKSNSHGGFRFREGVRWGESPPPDWFQQPKCFVVARSKKKGIDFAVVYRDDDPAAVLVTMDMPRTYKIDVADKDGTPIAGAPVFLCGGEKRQTKDVKIEPKWRYMRLDSDIGVSAGVTDAAGHIDLVGPNGAAFYVRIDGYAEGYGKGKIPLFPSARVHGKVTYPDGGPVVGAEVRYEYHGESLSWSDVALSDSEGAYSFKNVPTAGFRYSFMEPDSEQNTAEVYAEVSATDVKPESEFVAKSETLKLAPGEVKEQDIVLQRGAVFAGTVVNDDTGQPVPNMQFNIYLPTGGRYLNTIEVKTDAQGAFHKVVPPGTEVQVQWQESRQDGDYLIDEKWLRNNHWQPFRGTVTEDMRDLVFKVKLWPVHPLKGRVVGTDGQALAKAKVLLHSDAPAYTTDAKGEFTMKLAPTDRDFSLFAISEDKKQAGLVNLSAGATEAAISLTPTRDLDGQALNTEGLPAAGLKFNMDLKLNDSTVYGVRQEPTTDKEGRFKATDLCPQAKYYAWWSSDNDENRDYDYGNADIDLTALAEGEGIKFEAKQYLNALMGRVVDANGAPVANASVEVLSSGLIRRERLDSVTPITTDGQGEFVVPRMAPGNASLRVRAEGYKSAVVTAPSDSIDVAVTLKPASEPTLITIHVQDAEGKALSGIPVRMLWMATGKGEPLSRKLSRRADSKGECSFELAVAEADQQQIGNVLVGCDVPGYDVAWRGVALGEDSDLTLTLRKSGSCWSGRVLDSQGTPLADATVKVEGMQAEVGLDHRSHAYFGQFKDPAYVYTTDAEGRFRLERFGKHCPLSISAMAKGHTRESLFLSAERDKDNDIELRLSPGATISGRVVLKGAAGKGLFEGVSVLAQSTSNRGGNEAEVKPDGSFLIEGLRADTYRLDCHRRDGSGPWKYVCPMPPEVEAKAGETATVAVELEEGIPVRGTLVDKTTGQAPRGKKIVTVQKAKEQPVSGVQVKDDGSWEMYLYPGQFNLAYLIEGQGWRKGPPLTVEKGGTYEGIIVEAK